jgi:CDP-diacylglycerol--serine O-phosphatidyltransferase
VVVYHWGLSHLRIVGALTAFAYLACGAIRLARFNVLAARTGGGSSKFFTGLPIPLAAGVMTSLIMFHQRTYAAPTTRQRDIVALILVLSYLMVSNVRYRTFKQAKADGRTLVAFCTLLGTFIALARIYQPALALLVFFGGYVAVGLAEQLVRLVRPQRAGRAPNSVTGSRRGPPSKGQPPPDTPT